MLYIKNMRKMGLIFILIFSFLVLNIEAQDFRFGWNAGNINIYGDVLDNEFNSEINILHFNWIINKFSIGFNIFDIYNINNDKILQCSILPVKLAYVPLNFNNWLFLSIYGKAGWQLIENNNYNHIENGIYGSIGIKFLIFPELKFHYSPYFSAFIEYDTHKKLKIGLGMDLSFLIYCIIKGYQASKEEEYGRSFDWTK